MPIVSYCYRYNYKLHVSNLSALYFTIQLLIGACLLYSLFLLHSEEYEEGSWLLAGGSSGIKDP